MVLQICVMGPPVSILSNYYSSKFFMVINIFYNYLHLSLQRLDAGISLLLSNLYANYALVLPYFLGNVSAYVQTCVSCNVGLGFQFFFYFFLNMFQLLYSLFTKMKLDKYLIQYWHNIRNKVFTISTTINMQTEVDLEESQLLSSNIKDDWKKNIQRDQNKIRISKYSPKKDKLNHMFVLVFVLLLGIFVFGLQMHWSSILTQYQQLYMKQQKLSYPHPLIKVKWLRAYNLLTKQNQMKNNQIKSSFQKQQELQAQAQDSRSEQLKYLLNRMQQPIYHKQLQILTYKYRLQLPICILINVDQFLYNHQLYVRKYEQIVQSIQNNNYTNYLIINPHGELPQHINSKIKYPKSKQQNETNYSYYRRIIMQECQPNALIFLLSDPLVHNGLHELNLLHQGYNIWATCAQLKQDQPIQVFSFYQRLFQLIQLNDFDHIRLQWVNFDIKQGISLAIIQLSINHIKQIKKSSIFKLPEEQIAKKGSYFPHKRIPYTPLIRLSQDIKISTFDDKSKLNIMKQTLEIDRQIIINTLNLSMQKMSMAIQYQDETYLPKEHSLSMRQYQYYNSLYNISLFMQQQKQLPLCITILSHNNIQNNRYKKLFLSILQQQYKNYHIVFIDDVSDDKTLEQTINFVYRKGFSKDRITFIKNSNRKYANYNILNAAFNFCLHGDVQVVIDGDDQIIGRYVFALINAAYQKQHPDQLESWVVYTNFKSNLYQFGRSFPLKDQQSYLTPQRKRVNSHFLGQLRTWRTALIKTIPQQYHKTKTGRWLDTLYDDSIQHSIFQLSTKQRIKYIPQICYEYNRQYGDNDDSSQQKVIYRLNVYEYILSLPALSPLNGLNQAIPNQQLVGYFLQQMKNQQFIIQAS